MSLILRVQVVREDLALVQLPPIVLILLEVLDERAEERVKMSVCA